MLTIEEAIALRKKYKTAGVVQSVRLDIAELVETILLQEQQLQAAVDDWEQYVICDDGCPCNENGPCLTDAGGTCADAIRKHWEETAE